MKGRASEKYKTLNNEWIRNLMNLVRSENLRRDKDEFPRGRVDQVGDELVEQLEEAKEQRREHAMLSKSGTYRLLQCGADHLAEGVEEGLREGSSLPKEDMQYA